jgi:DNA (cytosine-5)-methyltransferase 1
MCGTDAQVVEVLRSKQPVCGCYLIYSNRDKRKVAMTSKKITFIDLFAGIGGFHLAFHNLGAKCVFVAEWDEPARQTYEKNFAKIEPELFTRENREKLFTGDITKVEAKDIPDFDILTGGFPCQPFSQAGLKKGFNETRGTLFFDIARIIKEKQPSAFFIENVRGLLNHNGGETFATIKKVITKDLGYSFCHKVIFASDFGVPQHRPRLFMVGFRDKKIKFDFPEPQELKMTMSDVFGGKAEKKVGYTLRVGGRGSNINDRRNWDSYLVNGKVKRLSPKEGLKMQGFPDNFAFPVSEVQAMKQLGNSVAVPAIQATAEQIIEALRKAEK